MKSRIIILFITGCLLSCAPARNIRFEVMSPALTDLPDREGNYLILNSSYIPDTIQFTEHLVYYLFSEEKIILDTMITRQLFDGLFSVLNESPVPGLLNAEYLEIRTSDTTGFLNPLSPVAVAEICNEYNADYLISFEYYDFNVEIGSDSPPNSGFFSSNSYSSYCNITTELIWRIYRKDGKLEDDHVFMDTILWNGQGPGYDDAFNTFTNTLDCIRETFWLAGIGYGKRISPSWVQVNRPLYTIREKMYSGYFKITRDKNRLQLQTTKHNKTKAYKACYNLAVLTEYDGDINNALSWIEKAMKYRDNIYVRKYYNILLDRQKSLEKLKNQTE